MQLNITTKLVKENAMTTKGTLWKNRLVYPCPTCAKPLHVHCYVSNGAKRFKCRNKDCSFKTIDERDLVVTSITYNFVT